ncbi:unnamed protein product, partial [marine sediment metagenome]
ALREMRKRFDCAVFETAIREHREVTHGLNCGKTVFEIGGGTGAQDHLSLAKEISSRSR